ncbi:sarcosine oxidase gamma subunit [Mesorhizobium soli]|uniref:sarcosine oxidase subunit gamma family protein n=1 Tax=Pseudaminobacter soli (ex Li et al. 2025) TaxID=1295366 RepID=UPI0024759ACD|nr:sarcosine oxidase subunit gamma family protein [Mesorhizobium soli]MDH6233576.1 sarcosine oxidase gamma subunit [Mesorhizobium soli]
MRNLAEKWAVVPDWQQAAIVVPGLTIRSMVGLSQYLVSGNLDAWSRASGVPAKGVGAFGKAEGERYAAQVARDRMLVVSANPLDIQPAWHGEGFGVTVVSAGLQVFEAEGAATAELIARATTLDPSAGSSSAALSFAGANAVVYRHGDKLRIHVDRGLATYLWTWMETAANNIAAAAKG